MATVLSTVENSVNFLKIDQSGSAAGNGTNVSLTTDYSGNAVNNPPDIGAFAVASGGFIPAFAHNANPQVLT